MEKAEIDLLVEERLKVLDELLNELMQTCNVEEANALADVLVNHFKDERIEKTLFAILSDKRFDGEELTLLKLYGKVFSEQENFSFLITKVLEIGIPTEVSKECMSLIVNFGAYLKQKVLDHLVALLNEYNASELNDWQKEVVSFLINFYENQQDIRNFYVSYYKDEPE